MAKKSPLLVSPAGEAGFLHIFKPNTKFNPDGTFSAELILSADEGQPLLDQFKKLAQDAKAKYLAEEKDAKKKAVVSKYELTYPGKPEMNDDGEETGRIVFNFKNGAQFKGDDGEIVKTKIIVVDAGGVKPVPPTTKVGRGSTIKIAYQILERPAIVAGAKLVGISCRLKFVQLLKLVEFGGGVSGVFDAEEGGYEAGDTDDTASAFGSSDTGSSPDTSTPNGDLE